MSRSSRRIRDQSGESGGQVSSHQGARVRHLHTGLVAKYLLLTEPAATKTYLMARPPRAAVGGLVYHVHNRANASTTLFATPEDYDAFVKMVAEAQVVQPMTVVCYCVMPNHWHPSGLNC